MAVSNNCNDMAVKTYNERVPDKLYNEEYTVPCNEDRLREVMEECDALCSVVAMVDEGEEDISYVEYETSGGEQNE